MATRPLICGWVRFDDTPSAPGGVDAMLRAENIRASDTQIEHGSRFQVATTGSATSIARDDASGRIAIVRGRPRWNEDQIPSAEKTRGAAHTLLESYSTRGTNCITSLCGNFALVLLDMRANAALLAIDRIGIERLCFAQRGPLLVFSTSARAVAAHPGILAPVSQQALFDYLFCHMVPSPGTAFDTVGKLLPAESLEVRAGKVQRRHYWQLTYDIAADASDEALQRQFVSLTRQAVERQLDERTSGAFLSGGTDSSTVTGMLGEVSGRAADTFSIGFDAPGYDELDFARISARHFRANAHEFYVTADHVVEAAPIIASAYDEPFGNASAVPTYFCARLAREQGIEVMLAGDGGDEFFGGNERYAKQGVFEHYQRVPEPLRRLIEPLIMMMPFSPSLMPLRKLQSYLNQARIPLPDRLETYNFLRRSPLSDIFEPEFLAGVDTERPLELMRETYFRCAAEDPVERMMHLDHKITLADNDLRKVTRMCEEAGVEARFPFADDDLVAFSATLAPRHKVHRGRLRVLFKDALRGYLPDETLAKSKHGFGLPFGVWLNTHDALRGVADDALTHLKQRGIVRKTYIDGLLRAHADGSPGYYGVMIWILIQLELWLRGNDPPTSS